ncbi:TPA: DUF996 domain-containing protein [Candidatus Bathyarchaeota archaeon]|nr:DUF996 domain-containing protein [Candidatus Bathyarchaeota archaeon]HIJ08001.1 DUF996 domain-containing protein [Candidatus Bathyarchaeota archaeon]
MSFEYNRFIGRAGTLLIVSSVVATPIIVVAAFFLGLFPSTIWYTLVFSLWSYSGQIMFLVAMKRFGDFYEARGIFKNALYGFIVTLVGSFVFIFLTFGVLSYMRNLMESAPPVPGTPPFTSFIGAFMIFLVGIWLGVFVLSAIQGVFYRRAFYALAEKSGEGNFKQAGFLMFLGGLLAIVVVGALIFFVGWIFAVLGFSSMKQPALQPSTSRSFCPACGVENAGDAVFCSQCGNKLRQEPV